MLIDRVLQKSFESLRESYLRFKEVRAEWLKALFKESTERTLDLSKEILSVSGDHLIALFKKLENKWHLVPEIAILSRAKGHTFNEKYQEHRVFSFQSYDH